MSGECADVISTAFHNCYSACESKYVIPVVPVLRAAHVPLSTCTCTCSCTYSWYSQRLCTFEGNWQSQYEVWLAPCTRDGDFYPTIFNKKTKTKKTAKTTTIKTNFSIEHKLVSLAVWAQGLVNLHRTESERETRWQFRKRQVQRFCNLQL